jgi:hypothetical protein
MLMLAILLPEIVTVMAPVPLEGLRVITLPLTAFTVPVLFFEPPVNS